MHTTQKLIRSSLGLAMACFFVIGAGPVHTAYAASAAPSPKARDMLGLPESFSLDSRKFVLARAAVLRKGRVTSGTKPGEVTESISQIYVPEHGDALKPSDRIVVTATSGFPPSTAIRAFVEKIGEAHQSDPYQLLFGLYVGNEHKEDMLGESTLFDKAGGAAFLEWSATRFSPFTLKDGRSGVVRYDVTHRVYGTDERADAMAIRDFIRSPERQEREDFVGSRDTLPIITQLP